MVPDGFALALAAYAESIEDVTPLESERDALFVRMKDGESGALINSTINGKIFGWSPATMTIEEKFTAFVEAIKIFKGTKVTVTYPDFRKLRR